MILRRRRLFSHYRQYEQWRRRQFSYDPCYYRASPLPLGQASCEYGLHGPGTGPGTGPGPGGAGAGVPSGAFRRRRQYRRQYSCAERSRENSREGSRESRESSSFLQRHRGVVASDTINTDSSTLNHTLNNTNHSERVPSFDSSECGALAYQPLHCGSRHFYLPPEEHSVAISERCTRSRINSAIFVSSEGRGFDSIEFLRRHGSQSVLCRKYRSAENITDNERKKNFADKRQWRTDESAECIAANANANHNGNASGEDETTHIELHEARTLPVVNTNAVGEQACGASAAVTAASIIVGSISIEAPPAYMKDELVAPADQQQQLSAMSPDMRHTPTFHESTETVEELIVVATDPAKPRHLVRQRSSGQSPALSPHNSPKALHLRGVRPKIIALPMVSVSGPSPPHERPPPSECL